MIFLLLDRLASLSFSAWVLIILLTAFLTLAFNMLISPRSVMVHRRIEDMSVFASGTPDEKILKKSLLSRVGMMIEERFSRFFVKNMKKGKLAPLKLKLVQSGDYITDPTQHWAKKAMYTMGFSVLGLLMGQMIYIAVFAALGYVLPDMRLDSKIKKRQLNMRSQLPDYLDLLAATAPSSKNLEDAISKVCERVDSDISKEFKQALEEVNAGRRMRDALKDLSYRCGITEIDSLVAQINQSESFGTGVEKTLIVQAEKMRKLKKLIAEIKARQAAVLLITPSLFLLITCLILIAGPSVVAIFDAQTPGNGL